MLRHTRLGEGRTVGYVRINNSLGSVELIREFDAALGELKDSVGLILDLRDTPGGGNTTVARGILGRFVAREGFYQKHSLPAEEREFGVRRSWAEAVSPRGDFPYDRARGGAGRPLDREHGGGDRHRPGRAGPGDGRRHPDGRPAGATHGVTLPNSKIGVNFPAEKLFHVNGTPREDFVPPVQVDLLAPVDPKEPDAVLAAGLRTVRAAVKAGGPK